MKCAALPLYSDVDGTLIKSDLLIESVFAMLKRQPWNAFALLFWLLKGKAFLKARIADNVNLDPRLLPYNAEFVEFLRSESENGREIYLASASDERLVSAIASHLGFVRGVLATARGKNLKGKAKVLAIRAHRGAGDFAYAGDSRADLLVWKEAAEAVLVNAPSRVERSARDITSVVRVFHVPHASLGTYLEAMRLHQWLKNILVFVPLILSPRWRNAEAGVAAVTMFFAFGLMASGVYLLNDLLDLPSDRRHPSKQRRPIAAGRLSLTTAAIIAVMLMSFGIISASMVSIREVLVLCGYLLMSLAYSLHMKTIVLVDVLILAGLYTLRIIAGIIAAEVSLSVWLLGFSGFLFLSLALLKRCVELDRIEQLNQRATHGRDYRVNDASQLNMMGIASGYMSVLVIALYIDSSKAAVNYQSPEMLWLVCPLLVYWVSRMWIKVARGEMHDDPLVYSARDYTSLGVFLAITCVWLLARFI